LVEIGCLEKEKEGILRMGGEVEGFDALVVPVVDSMNYSVYHQWRYPSLLKKISKAGDGGSERFGAVWTAENMIPIFIQSITPLTSIVMPICPFTEFTVGGPESVDEFGSRATLFPCGAIHGQSHRVMVYQCESAGLPVFLL